MTGLSKAVSAYSLTTQAHDFRTLKSNIFAKTEEGRKTVLACSYGAQVGSFEHK